MVRRAVRWLRGVLMGGFGGRSRRDRLGPEADREAMGQNFRGGL